MGNLVKAMTSRDAALDLPSGGLTTILNPYYESRKIDLCGYHHPHYFAILVPEMRVFSKICNRS